MPVFLLLYHLVPGRVKMPVLLVLSFVFYAWGSPRNLILLVLSILFNYAAGLQIDAFIQMGRESMVRISMILTVAVDLAVLCFFKYVTGLPCPGCGLQRAMHQLMHGHIKASLLLCPYAYFLAGVFLSMWIFPRATRTLAFALLVLGTTFVYAILRIFGLVP